MRFTKMQGAGNDFVIINNLEEQIPCQQFPALARALCTRRLSVGADGIMIVDAAQNGGDYRMTYYNADGSLGEMCGNGARCIARYGYENGLAGEVQRVETTSGLVTGRRIDRTNYEVRLRDPSVLDLTRTASAHGKVYPTPYVELGVPGLPHAIVHLENWQELPENELFSLGSALRYAKAFPKGANVTFWRRLGDGRFAVRTFERGVEDFTLACGTGCGSTAAILTLLGETDGRRVTLECKGGTLSVSLCREGDTIRDVCLTGPTRIVCVGETVDPM